MDNYIFAALQILKEAGMVINYPSLMDFVLDENDKNICRIPLKLNEPRFSCIESNPQLKFIMIFSMLDYFLDKSWPKLSGLSFSQKYRKIPRLGDYCIMLKEIFRISKVIRNSLVHKPTEFIIRDGILVIDYEFQKTQYRLTISTEAFDLLATAIYMYVKGDLGKGKYFLGIMRSIYNEISNGIKEFSDEFVKPNSIPDTKTLLEQPRENQRIMHQRRDVLHQPKFEVNDGFLKFSIEKTRLEFPVIVDLFFKLNDVLYLLPFMELDSEMRISMSNLTSNWKREGSYPWIDVGNPGNFYHPKTS